MINGQQIKTKEKMQVNFNHHIRSHSKSFTKPEFKFMQDISLGILKSQSVINNQIALSLLEEHSPKNICKRFTRHLNKEDFGTRLQNSIILKQCRGFDMETGIIIDESDIIKAKAKKMEGLQEVRDGSTGEHDKLGYALLNTIAFNRDDVGYQISPISSDLIARDRELDSVSQILEDRLVEINLASCNKGVYLFDRGYDDRALFKTFNQMGMNYIVRGKGIRNLIVDGEEIAFSEVLKMVKRERKIKLKENNEIIMCGLMRVKLRLDPYPRKTPETIDLWLVVSKFAKHPGETKGIFHFLCDFPSLPNLSEKEIIKKTIRMYRTRWKIEEVHKHIKQVYGWENIQLMTYLRLQNMNQVLLLTMCYLYSLKRYATDIMFSFPHQIIYRPKLWKKIYDFIYYKLSNIVSLCFSFVTRYNVNKFKGVWSNYMQLEIPCMKNGGM